MIKILILVLSFEDNELYTSFRKCQEETWDSVNDDCFETYYYFGGSTNQYIQKNKIYLNCDEGLINCGHKTIACLNAIKNFDFDYIFRTNSSSYIDKKLLYNFLINKPKDKYYAGIIGEHNNIKFASGSGYILSKDLVFLVLNNKEYWDHSILDDVSLGKLLSKFFINPVQTERIEIVVNNYLMFNFIKIPLNYFHYRLKSKKRKFDLLLMKKIFKNKNVYNRG